MEKYDNDFLRSKREHSRVKRGSYTRTAHTVRSPLIFASSASFTSSVGHLLNTPRLRYEFDILQSSHYNTSFSYYQSLKKFASEQSINLQDSTSHSSFRMVGSITIIEVLRGVNPFDVYIPRLNIVRELISGYNPEFDLRRLREVSVSVSTQLEYAPLTTIVALFYLLQYPTDTDGFRQIVNEKVPNTTMQNIGNHLYRQRYARVPILIVLI